MTLKVKRLGDFALFDTSPLTQFSKFNNFLWVCWFFGKNLSNFVPPVWKLHNPYCHNMHYLNNFRYSKRCRSFFAIIRPYVSIQFRQSNLGSDEITWKTKTSKVLSINTSPLHCLLNCDYNYLWQPKTFSCRLGFASMGRNDESALFFNASFSVFGPLRCP